MGLKRLAGQFGESYSWALKILSAQWASGSTDRHVGKARGFPSRLSPELRQRLAERIAQHPDAALVELKDWLLGQTQVSVSVQRLCALYCWKWDCAVKKVCTPLNRTRKGAKRNDPHGRSGWRASLPSASSSWMEAELLPT